MATENTTRVGNKGAYYAAQPVRAVVGLTSKRKDHFRDSFRGTGDALVASGIIPFEFLPGMPGRSQTKATYRPLGEQREGEEGWHHVPGYLEVFKYPDGTFLATLTVSREEQRRREAQGMAEEQARRAAQMRHQPLNARPLEAEFSRGARTFSLGKVAAMAADLSPARFVPGDSAILCDSDYGSGEKVVVVEPFDAYEVKACGTRLGYVVRYEDSNDLFFAPPFSLLDADWCFRHVRLVGSQQSLRALPRHS